MQDSTIWIALGIGLAISAIIITVIEIWKLYHPGRRRQIDVWRDDPDMLGDRKQWLSPDDGPPGGNRGRVWTDLERSEHRQAKERKKLRIVAGSCPPHDPEYDETVNETYCQKCLERLPNARSTH